MFVSQIAKARSNVNVAAVAALSTQLSTAALDKHPQSKERGITLDLGFSSFTCPLPPHLKGLQADKLQVRVAHSAKSCGLESANLALSKRCLPRSVWFSVETKEQSIHTQHVRDYGHGKPRQLCSLEGL